MMLLTSKLNIRIIKEEKIIYSFYTFYISISFYDDTRVLVEYWDNKRKKIIYSFYTFYIPISFYDATNI